MSKKPEVTDLIFDDQPVNQNFAGDIVKPNKAAAEKNLTKVEIHPADFTTNLDLTLASTDIAAGFPSPALDFIDLSIDLNQQLIKHPSATFYGRVKGDSMMNSGIADGDLLVIDRSFEPVSGKIAVCYLDGEFTLKRIKIEHGQCFLMPDNPDFKPIAVDIEQELVIWGLVTYVIKKML